MNVLNKKEQTLILDMIYDCVRCDSLDDFKSIIGRMSNLLQSNNIVFLTSRCNDPTASGSIKEINVSYPEEWTDIYRTQNYIKIDPLVSHGLSGLLYWQDVYKQFAVDSAFYSQAKSFGLANGYSHIQVNNNHFGLLSIADKSLKNNDRNRKILHYLVPHFHTLVDKLAHREAAPKKIRLTEREREVLLWIIEGKTNWEASVILNVGVESVKTHIANIISKLGACNRTHAASIALQNNLLYQ